MVIRKDRYASELTEQSLAELQKFARWFGGNQGGSWPTVIGGWAVWSYHAVGFGSRDVDLVLPTDRWIKDMMIETYFPSSGFKPYRVGDPILGELHHGKRLAGGDVVFFDLISAETPREDSTNMGVTVDWNWIYEDQLARPIGNDTSINVPTLEFLITLKIIGCISRRRQLRMVDDKSYLQSKIWKDCYDVANLTNHLFPDNEKLQYHFQRTGLNKELTREFLEACDGNEDALKTGNSQIGPIERLLHIY